MEGTFDSSRTLVADTRAQLLHVWNFYRKIKLEIKEKEPCMIRLQSDCEPTYC